MVETLPAGGREKKTCGNPGFRFCINELSYKLYCMILISYTYLGHVVVQCENIR